MTQSISSGRFAGKRVLVTGAASGIGRATALLLAKEGACLTIADRNGDGLAETLAQMGAGHRSVVFDAADVTSCHALVAEAAAGGLDILCNIAGMLDWGATEDFCEDRFERLIQVNLLGTYALCRAAMPHLVASEGNIVNMASTAGLTGIPYSAAYCASKHAVVGLTKSLAAEFAAKGVRINAVCPGHVNTPMGHQPAPSGDLDWSLVMRASPKLKDGTCEPDDIARAVAYLAGPDGLKVTGAALVVDGGQLAA